MIRTFKMTPLAQQSLWCNLSTGQTFLPTQFYVEGDSKNGYEISYVDEKLCGFTLISLRSFYATKELIRQMNETGKCDYERYFSVGSTAYRNQQLPEKIEVTANNLSLIDSNLPGKIVATANSEEMANELVKRYNKV